jgi:digeranylgeranylglycerophospholipid reductase
MPKLKCDVTVIGAGPAGSTTARTIARRGFDVILVEKDEYPGKTNVCAGGAPESIIKDLKLSSEVIEKKIIGGKHYFPWGLKISDLDGITVYRNVFDKELADKAVEEGVEMMTNTLITDVIVKSEGVRVKSEEDTIDSKLIVFADGPNTLAYRRFGIGFKPESDKTCVSVACEVRWENNPLDHTEFYYGYDISPWGYGWIFPKRNTVNVGVGCLYSELNSNSNIIESLNYLLQRYPLTHEKLKGKEIVWLSSALIPAAPAKQIFGERMLVVGDAAGMVDPVTGGGIAHAINGGMLAGKISGKALEENDFSSMFLSQYQRLWHKTTDYSYIYSKYLLSNVFLYLLKFDKRAYPKLAVITQGGIRKVFDTLKFIYKTKKEIHQLRGCANFINKEKRREKQK